MQALVVARTELETDLRRGLQAQEFVLHYQVQVNVCSRPLGAEALVRWKHPQRGLVSPAQFIGLAEETGLILQLGQMVLDAACQQLVQWAAQPPLAKWIMAVNVSALQFAQEDFVDSVTMALQMSGAEPGLLKLELTESMLVGDIGDVIDKMRRIKALGVSFSLDDFGTGYSSLAYLKRLPMDQLKVDQSFVRDLLTDPDDAVICRTIVSLGHNLGMHVIAEGVETQGQADALVAMGCDAFQGYLFGRPVGAAELMSVHSQMTI
jgi:EAL domain-containing protein (putative c-di-GMP-specific phosphodiesterase class I)